MTVHLILPIFDENSEILILGSFPSVKSREDMFFYAHPKNRFWKVISKVFDSDEPLDKEAKTDFLLKNKIALWDVIASCDINGSADSSIKNVIPNNLSEILEKADIKRIYVNGKTAFKYYNKYQKEHLKKEAVCLPSTSPANAAWSLEKLLKEWNELKNV